LFYVVWRGEVNSTGSEPQPDLAAFTGWIVVGALVAGILVGYAPRAWRRRASLRGAATDTKY
jgi:uncharacterized membrane protein YraQ (UPF0718 family)